VQINSLLAGNEVEKNQLLRQAALKYSGARASILDQYEQLRLGAEKEKAAAQAKLDEAGALDQKLIQVMQSASPEFLKTGQPKTAQDQFIIFKYPKEAEAYMKMLTDSKSMSGNSGEKQKLITLVDDIANSSGLGRITGIQGMVPLVPGSSEQLVKGQIDQLKALLSLENRQKLKGSGAISDREMGILERASSLLNQGLNEQQFKQVLAQLKAELSSGSPASISGNSNIITAPDGQQIMIID